MYRDEQGIAIVMALITIASLLATTAALVPLAVAEHLIAAASREAAACRFAAEGIVFLGMAELQVRPSWDSALDGSGPATFADASRTPMVTRARRLDLDGLAAAFPPPEPGAWGRDAPRWQLFAWGPAASLAPAMAGSTVYVALWVADDGEDGDGDPARDANGRLALRGEAFGPIGGRRVARATLERGAPPPAALRLLDWRAP